MATRTAVTDRPEQLSLLAPSELPVQFRLDRRTRERGWPTSPSSAACWHRTPPAALRRQTSALRDPLRLVGQAADGASDRTASQCFRSGSSGMIASEVVVTPLSK